MNLPIRSIDINFTNKPIEAKYIKAANSYISAAKDYDPSRWNQCLERLTSLKVLIAVLLEMEDVSARRRVEFGVDFNTPPVASTFVHDRAHQVTKYLNSLSNLEKNDFGISWWKGKVPVSYGRTRAHRPFQYCSQLLSTLRRYGLVSYDKGNISWNKLVSLTKKDKFSVCREFLGWGSKSKVTSVPTTEQNSADNLSVLAKKLFGDSIVSETTDDEVTIEFRHYLKASANYWLCINVSDESVSDGRSRFTHIRHRASQYAYRIYLTVADKEYIIAPSTNVTNFAFIDIPNRDKLLFLLELSKNTHQMNIVKRYKMLPLDAVVV